MAGGRVLTGDVQMVERLEELYVEWRAVAGDEVLDTPLAQRAVYVMGSMLDAIRSHDKTIAELTPNIAGISGSFDGVTDTRKYTMDFCEYGEMLEDLEVLRDNMHQALAYMAQCPECESLLPKHADGCELAKALATAKEDAT